MDIELQKYGNISVIKAQNMKRVDNKKSNKLTQTKHKIILTNLFGMLCSKLRHTL
jgi:hypothetical protein